MIAGEILRAAFAAPRDPRSPEYKDGVLAALGYRLGESAHVRCPYPAGTAQADAFFAGTDEGHRLAREHLDQQHRA